VTEVPTSPEQTFVDELRRRRAEMRESMTALEVALARPPAGGLEHWAARTQAALAELSGDLRAHVEITEGEGGLYSEVLQVAPRLAGPVGVLIREHKQFARLVDELLGLVGQPVRPEQVATVRELGTDLLVTLVRHRQRGSDLVFDAYQLDVGGGD
jgi:hypothetical protein